MYGHTEDAKLWQDIDRIMGISGYRHYFAPRGFAALASPLPRVPRNPPRELPPRLDTLPLPAPLAIRDAGAGVVNLGVGLSLEGVGGLSTKDVSVVLERISYELQCRYHTLT